MSDEPLSVQAFYTAITDYMRRVDPAWDNDRWSQLLPAERKMLANALGPADGRSVLDCTCGSGHQATALAQLGWRVTGTDIVGPSLRVARKRAAQHGIRVRLELCDVREIGGRFDEEFDAVISCMALDNLDNTPDVARAMSGMFAALKPGGHVYIRLRDFDHLLAARPRYEFREERLLADGRVIRLEDWEYEDDDHVVCVVVFLREQQDVAGSAWTTDIFRLRRRALRRADIEKALGAAGFRNPADLSRPNPWHPMEIVADKP